MWWNGGGTGTSYTKLADVAPNVYQFTQSSTDPAGLTAGEFYRFKVLSTNGVGSSILSPDVLIRAATVPDAPTTPILVAQATDNIQFSWTAPYDGMDPIYDYKVLWDSGLGTNVFTELASSTFGQTSYSTTALLTAGVYY